MAHRGPVFGVSGWSGSGKTTLVEKLLPVLAARGLRVSTLKHAHHTFELDHPGKDSWRHRRAGAVEVMVSSTRRWALIHELRHEREPDFHALLAQMSPVDLVIVEGFKREPFAKLEVRRSAVPAPPLAPDDPAIVAIAADAPVAGATTLPCFDLDDAEGIADFIVRHCRLERRRRGW